MSQVAIQRYKWNTINWTKVERKVFKLQKRIYRASQDGEVEKVRKLQKLLVKSTHVKFLAVRRVTQDNRGKKTAGVDGQTALTQKQREQLVEQLQLVEKAAPIRRVWIPKPGKTERRPLGIPTIKDRAKQALVKMALEPEWEAKFEANSYGFRPGRSCHDAMQAIYESIKRKQAYVLDADISGCFDNIEHQTLLDKIQTNPKLRRIIKCWLKAGIVDNDVFQENEKGTPQGGIISPLLANIALHGMETDTKNILAGKLFEYMKAQKGKASYLLAAKKISIIRYADDFVVIHPDIAVVEEAKAYIEQWLRGIGLELKPAKTRICHTTLPLENNQPGFNFLGFHVRQYTVKSKKQGYATYIKPSKESIKKHLKAIRDFLRRYRGTTQEAVIKNLNPIIKGWALYFRSVVSRKVFEKTDHKTFLKLWQWARFRHPHKGQRWIKDKYFPHHKKEKWRFNSPDGSVLVRHSDHKIQRFTKVKGSKSPYDGDFAYWATRMGRYPLTPNRISTLLKHQLGKCRHCQLYMKTDDVLEVHHLNDNHNDNRIDNLALVHGHCHDEIHK